MTRRSALDPLPPDARSTRVRVLDPREDGAEFTQVVEHALEPVGVLGANPLAVTARIVERDVVDFDPRTGTLSTTVDEVVHEALVVTPSHLLHASSTYHVREDGFDVVGQQVVAWPRSAVAEVRGPEPWVIVVQTTEGQRSLEVNQRTVRAVLGA